MPIAQLDLADWKRQIFELYGHVRRSPDPPAAWNHWRAVRDRLFAAHPQSPVPEEHRGGFGGLRYFDYDPAARVLADIVESRPCHADIPTSGDSAYRFTRFALARLELLGRRVELELYWLEGYGGGIFLPFGDTTNGVETCGEGRYLLDTVKGADLGTEQGRLVLDFNFSYNPSCVYDPRWVCPLVPPPNRLALPVRAGERL